jgi:16S rRNA G1207 methylase RsmC
MPKQPQKAYNEERMEQALADVRNGTKIYAAAKTHDVPRSTLIYKFKEMGSGTSRR